jgi:hypothetical protein
VLEHAGLLTEFGEALECRVPEVAQCDDGSVAAAYALNVASSGVYARARGRVVRICDSVGDALTLRLRLVEEIGRVVGFDAYAWLMTDPETSVGSAPLADVPLLPEPAKRRDWDIAATRVER